MMPVYLLHFDRPYKHARHYTGFAEDADTLYARIEQHRQATDSDGKHHRLMQVIRAAGIGFRVARVWPDGDRNLERRIKSGGSYIKRLCPYCKEAVTR